MIRYLQSIKRSTAVGGAEPNATLLKTRSGQVLRPNDQMNRTKAGWDIESSSSQWALHYFSLMMWNDMWTASADLLWSEYGLELDGVFCKRVW